MIGKSIPSLKASKLVRLLQSSYFTWASDLVGLDQEVWLVGAFCVVDEVEELEAMADRWVTRKEAKALES